MPRQRHATASIADVGCVSAAEHSTGDAASQVPVEGNVNVEPAMTKRHAGPPGHKVVWLAKRADIQTSRPALALLKRLRIGCDAFL